MATKRPPKFDPFVHAPKKIQARFKARMEGAHRSAFAAITLQCVECMGYSYTDAKDCESNTCPLWAIRKRAFKDAKE